MTHSVSHTPMTINPVTAAPMHRQMALTAIWLHPQPVLAGLADGNTWSWIIPIGLALLIFYVRLFTLALLHDPAVTLLLLPGVVRLLIGWPLCATLLYLLSQLAGGYPRFLPILGMYAWSTLPLTLRDALQVIYMWLTGQLLRYPGLSGLVADQEATHWAARTGHLLLGWLDLATLWQLGLLVLAVRIGAQLSLGKATAVVALFTLLALLLRVFVMLI